jgi:hypothetical protein
MTGRELWAEYQHYTRDLTEHGRKLGFAGAAVCWIFKSADFTFPAMIYLALLFFIGYFVCDILHGLSAALTLRFFTQHHEKKLWQDTGSIEGDIHKPRWVDWPAFAFFIIKGIMLVVGFGFIGFYILGRLVC